MKRRIFSVLLSSALLLTALAGCGQGGEADPSGSPSDSWTTLRRRIRCTGS